MTPEIEERLRAMLTEHAVGVCDALSEGLNMLRKPTQHGRYAEKSYADDFNDGLDTAIEFIEEQGKRLRAKL